MQESTSLLILWLLSSLKQERSTLCLIQMLECPAAQAEIALHRVTADGLAEQRDETWNLTQAGADHLREALPALLFRDTGSPLEELISACESKMPETACEICTKRMRVLRRRADTAGSAGYLELLLNQLAQWQNRRLTAPEARSFVHYAFAAHVLLQRAQGLRNLAVLVVGASSGMNHVMAFVIVFYVADIGGEEPGPRSFPYCQICSIVISFVLIL